MGSKARAALAAQTALRLAERQRSWKSDKNRRSRGFGSGGARNTSTIILPYGAQAALQVRAGRAAHCEVSRVNSAALKVEGVKDFDSVA